MWSGPRNISTAMLYSFKQRQDTAVFDEPFFGCFLKKTGVWRPSREEVLQSMELDPDKVFKRINSFDEKPNVFLKNMANHMEGLNFEKIMNWKNIILLRHPLKVLNSYTKHIESPSTLDLAYLHQLKIIDFLQERGREFLIVNSDKICESPKTELQKICKFLELGFSEDMLSWEKGPIKEDGVWAKYWYHNVHNSTGFSKKTSPIKELNENLKEIYEESLNHYHQIIKQHE